MDSIKVIIADNNFNDALNISKIVKQVYLKNIAIVYDISQLYKQLESTTYDLLILNHDLIGLNIVNFMEKINPKGPILKHVVLLTSVHNTKILNAFYNLGIDFIINHKLINQLLGETIKVLLDRDLTSNQIIKLDLEATLKIRKRIKDKLNHLKLPIKLLGYNYLLTAIETVYLNDSIGHAASKKLYPLIASQFKCNSASVERSIRNLLSKITTKHQNYYDLTNMEFIFKIVEELKHF